MCSCARRHLGFEKMPSNGRSLGCYKQSTAPAELALRVLQRLPTEHRLCRKLIASVLARVLFVYSFNAGDSSKKQLDESLGAGFVAKKAKKNAKHCCSLLLGQ